MKVYKNIQNITKKYTHTNKQATIYKHMQNIYNNIQKIHKHIQNYTRKHEHMQKYTNICKHKQHICKQYTNMYTNI